MLESDPQWYKDAVIYELHVRAFHDSIGDGMGDFRGLTQKLDYLQDLGITAIWLLPFYPSPLKDDGYDIADYTNIHSHYGSLRDFREFLDGAHQRGLRVITELVINHTSDQHPWFQRARRAPPGSPLRNFYVWSDTPERYTEARIIFKDFEPSNWTWDPLAHAYYWHRFYSHQPDLNYDNPAVCDALLPVVDFWMGMGVDGMRLDAVPYLFEREGTNCENLPETHQFLKTLRAHVDARFPDRMLLSEANQWPEDAAAYFGSGDETHMAFHFPVMPRLFMAIHMEDRLPIVDIMAQTPAIPEACQWALFLRNHDELTLEMVTDEERDYMYKAYASEPRARINLGIRRRLAPLLSNNRRRIELMNGLLFSLPGTPVVYYGDEIGMGDNIYLGDRNGVRTPMQWSGDRNAGFSRANPQKLYLPPIIDPEYHYETVNVEAQQNNPSSLLWWMKRLIALRKQYRAFGRGTLEFLRPVNRKILAFLRRHESECLLVVANLSRFSQSVELDLSPFHGLVPVELFGRIGFHPVGREPYLLTFSPHSFYWFALEPQLGHQFARATASGDGNLPVLYVPDGWEDVFERKTIRSRLEEALPGYLSRLRWGDLAVHGVKSAVIRERILFPHAAGTAYLCLLDIVLSAGESETCLLPFTFAAAGEEAVRVLDAVPQSVIAALGGGCKGLLHDALADPGFCSALLQSIAQGVEYPGTGGGQVAAFRLPAFAEYGAGAESLPPVLSRVEQRNTSIQFGDRVILKVFRRVGESINPELEIGRYLTERHYPYAPPVLGAIEYRQRHGEPMTLAALMAFQPNEGDAWQYTLDELSRFLERVLTLPPDERRLLPSPGPLLARAEAEPPPEVQQLLAPDLVSARLLGERTAVLHLALASATENPVFKPEPFNKLYQRSMYQSMRGHAVTVFARLEQAVRSLSPEAAEDARAVLARSDEILSRLRTVLDRKISALRTRCHGDFHLGQVLNTGKDYAIIDFEGDPTRPISERRLKRSPLHDVACLVRSFHYAAYTTLLGLQTGRGAPPGLIRSEDLPMLEPWAVFWYTWVSAAYLGSYLEAMGDSPVLPASSEERAALLYPQLLDKAISEIGAELTRRPAWVRIPLKGILQMLDLDTRKVTG